MNASASASQPLDILRPRTADGWGLGLAMAAGVHLLLVGALALGVRWKMANPEPVEAEVWAEVPTVAAPVAPPPPPPAPEPVVTPPPEPAPEPVKAVQPEPVPEPIPDVVVAKVTKEERKKPKKKEPVEVFETTPPKPIKKPAKPEKFDKPEKVTPKVPEKPPVKVAEKTQPKVEPSPKAKPTDKSPDNSAVAAAEREAQRRATLAKMMGELGSLGTSAQTGGPTAAYGGRIKARVKPNIVFTDNVSGNPMAVVEVRCGPDGRIIARRLIKASGVTAWDDAVLRAVDRTEVLPRDENGRVPPVLELEFRPNDF